MSRRVSTRYSKNSRKIVSIRSLIQTLKKRDIGNGIKKSNAVTITAPSKHAPVGNMHPLSINHLQAVKDSTRHIVSYEYHKSHTVLVEYTGDSTKDMFQVRELYEFLYFFRLDVRRKNKSTLLQWTPGQQLDRIWSSRRVTLAARFKLRDYSRQQLSPFALAQREQRNAAPDLFDHLQIRVPNSCRPRRAQQSLPICRWVRLIEEHLFGGKSHEMGEEERRVRRADHQRSAYIAPKSSRRR